MIKNSFIDKHFSWLMVLPAILILSLLVFGPVVYTLILSFTKWSVSSIDKPQWVALGNYIKIFKDPNFHQALFVTAYYTFGALFFQIVLGVALAQLLNRFFIGRGLVRTLLIIPMASTPVAISLVWRFMLNPSFGILNYFLDVLGLSGVPWLSQPATVIPALIFVDVWHWTPFVMLIALAGMSSVDNHLYESGSIDGASKLQMFWYVTLPLIRSTLFVAAILRFMDSMKSFDEIYIMTSGGPGIASRTLNLFIFDQAFRYFQVGYSSALVMIMIIIVMVISFIVLKLRRV
jgi:multiple sugar transport system permease protein